MSISRIHIHLCFAQQALTSLGKLGSLFKKRGKSVAASRSYKASLDRHQILNREQKTNSLSDLSKIWRISCNDEERAELKSYEGRRVVLTTPLYYANASPHMGSAYPTIAVDVLSRFYRLLGAKPVFITGTDEHGEKVATAAAKHKKSPLEHCDSVVEQFLNLWNKFGIRFDRFIRTTEKGHEALVSQFIQRVYDNGDIYKDTYDGLYCVDCEEYKDGEGLTENNLCKIHRKECVQRSEENYFFALSKYQKKLEKLLDENPLFVQPPERLNEVKGWLRQGLRDFAVSRANNVWGIPVPFDPTHSVYVWFDALSGYLSALFACEEEGISLDRLSDLGWPAEVHIIGKDILRFHALYWPAMLMSGGLQLPKRVFGHGFLTKDGMKMGKSVGNTLDPVELVDSYGKDAVRFYFIRGIVFGDDGDFSRERFIQVVNSELANNIGNLLHRSLNLLGKYCEFKIPVSSSAVVSATHPLRLTAESMAEKAKVCYHRLDFATACETMIHLAAEANQYIAYEQPWACFKSGEANKAVQCLVACLETVRIVATGLSPVTPEFSKQIYLSLGYPEEYFKMLFWDRDMKWGGLKAGVSFDRPKVIFPKIVSYEETLSSSLSH
ncbi:Methionine--tRNA ligase, chloroplastic/mitochondrial [Galdieria sulphuraria]|nr:Methionine--tRNA ligase, chloroplastic/mitochondrial [Galdieria sulphuraria]